MICIFQINTWDIIIYCKIKVILSKWWPDLSPIILSTHPPTSLYNDLRRVCVGSLLFFRITSFTKRDKQNEKKYFYPYLILVNKRFIGRSNGSVLFKY